MRFEADQRLPKIRKFEAYQKMTELENVPIAHTNSAKVSIWIVLAGSLSSPQKQVSVVVFWSFLTTGQLSEVLFTSKRMSNAAKPHQYQYRTPEMSHGLLFWAIGIGQHIRPFESVGAINSQIPMLIASNHPCGYSIYNWEVVISPQENPF
jgi:hypothetical protein